MKIRAVTIGAPVRFPLPAGVLPAAGRLARLIREALIGAGLEVQTTRLATPPLDTALAGRPGPAGGASAALDLARALEQDGAREGLEYSALGAIDTTAPGQSGWEPLLEAMPEIIARTERVFCAAMVGTRRHGINLAATRACGRVIARVARETPDGFGNLRFAALANCPPHIPFFPAAYHDGGEHLAAGIALEAADVAVAAFADATSLEHARERLIQDLAGAVQRVTETAAGAVGRYRGPMTAVFTGVDLSLAPFPAADRSMAGALERLGLPAFGAHGTAFLAAFLTECLQRVAGALGQAAPTGFSGLMLPVLEDAVLARRAAEGTFGVDSLLLYAALCGLGLDTVPLPGDTAPGELGAIILDMATLAVRLNKPLTARLFPVPGKRAGDPVQWDFAYFAPSRVLPVRGLAPAGLLAQAERYNPGAGKEDASWLQTRATSSTGSSRPS